MIIARVASVCLLTFGWISITYLVISFFIGLYMKRNKTVHVFEMKKSHLQFKWKAFKISRQVHIPRQQYLIYWKRCQYMPNKSDLYDRIRWDFCGCVNTTVWMHHLDANIWRKSKMKTTQECYMLFWTNTGSNTPPKKAAVRPFTSHLKNRLSKTNKMWGAAGEARMNS